MKTSRIRVGLAGAALIAATGLVAPGFDLLGSRPRGHRDGWAAFSDAPVESGAMKFMPGSHLIDQLPHVDTFHEHNLLTRGQEIAVEVDEAKAVDVILNAGEMSLHHVRLVHSSKPNTTGNRRIGFAIRYIPTYVRPVKIRDGAMLVRGTDRHGHFVPETAPWPISTMPPSPRIRPRSDSRSWPSTKAPTARRCGRNHRWYPEYSLSLRARGLALPELSAAMCPEPPPVSSRGAIAWRVAR